MSFLTRTVPLLLLLLAGQPAISSNAQPAPFTLYLAGDGGAAYSVESTPALAMLRDSLEACEGSCGVLFLGDNVYTSGLSPQGHPDRARGEQILDAQIEVARLATGPAIFLPGNHDSGGGGTGGDLHRLEEMERYIIDRLGDRAFLPRGGDPGPVVLHPHPAVALIIINSQWWFEADHRGERTGRLPEASRRDIVQRLDDLVREQSGRHVVLATHHPVRSAGDHALYSLGFSPSGLARQVLGAPQDYSDRHYQRYRHDILSLAERHPDLIIASGHEHNLTYFDTPGHHIVSGSLSKPEWASERTGATFASGDAGFAALRFSASGDAHLSFSAVGEDGVRSELFERDFGARPPVSATAAPKEVVSAGSGFAVPPPSFEVNAAPAYSEWHGIGLSAALRYTIPETRIRPRMTLGARSRFDLETRGAALAAGFHYERSAGASGINVSLLRIGRLDRIWGAALEEPVRHLAISIEPYNMRFAYGRMFGLTMAVAGRYHRTEADVPWHAPFVIEPNAVASAALRLGARVNTLDSEVVPEGGLDVNVDARGIFYDDRPAVLRFEGGFRFFRSFGFRRALTTALGTQAMMITGDPLFFDLANTSGVRGYAPLSWTGRGSIISSLELRQTLFHLDRRGIRPVGVLGFVDVGVLFPIERPYGPPTPDGWRPVAKGNPLVNSSLGAGVWANVSRRVVMNATVGSADDGVFLSLGPAFHF